MTNNDDIDYRAAKTQSLRSNIFYLLGFKQLVDSEKQENEQKFEYNISLSARNYFNVDICYMLLYFFRKNLLSYFQQSIIVTVMV